MKNKLLNIIILFSLSICFVYSDTSNSKNENDTNINCMGNCYEPEADAGENKNYYNGSTVELDGSESYDPDDLTGSGLLIYYWSGPSQITFNDNTSIAPSFASPFVNANPIDCSDSQYQTEEDCLDANEIWTTAGSSLIPISLVVNDGEYNSDIDKIIITLLENNTPPVLTIDQNYEVNKQAEFTLDASMTSDESSLTGTLIFSWDAPDFTITSYNCYDDDGEIIADAPLESCITLESPDVNTDTMYNINLTVSDGVDDLDIPLSINVLSNIIPFAVVGDDIEVSVSSTFGLSASNSFDLDESGTLTYQWDITDCENLGFSLAAGTLTSEDITLEAPAQSGVTCSASLIVDDQTDLSNVWSGEDLFISEYVESSSSTDNYIEIYNGTSNVVDLSQYTLTIHKNNCSAQYDVQLDNNLLDSNNNGFLNPGDAIFIIKSDAGDLCNSDYLDCGSGNVQFIEYSNINKYSGDEAIELYKNGTAIDVIGEPCNDPGSGWSVAGVSNATSEYTLVRQNFVVSGNMDWATSSGTDSNNSEWVVHSRNTFEYGGSHYNTICDNYINITTVTNLPPAFVEINHNVTNLVPGATLTVTGSAIDPESVDLTYSLGPTDTSVELIEGSEEVEIIEGICVDSNGDVENVTCNNDNDCSGVSTCNDALSKKYLTASFLVPEDFDTQNDITVDFEVSDGANPSEITSITFNVEDVNLDPTIVYQVEECASACYNDSNFNVIAPNGNGEYETTEGYEIRFNASLSTDATGTGVLIYDWSTPFLDVDGDGGNELELDGIDEDIFTITIPEYISTDRNFSFILTLSDGDNDLSGSLEGFTVVIPATMPIIGTIQETGNIFEYDGNTFTTEAGFAYEGMVVELDGSSVFDPDGNIEDLEFNWSRISSEGTSLFGVCVNDVGSIQNIPCDTSADCTDPINDTCSENVQIAYMQLPIHIGNDSEFTVRLDVDDTNGNDSEQAELLVSTLARYPVAHAGYDFDVVLGEQGMLSSYLSQDNQESEVTLGSYNQSGTWEETGKNIIANYNNYELVLFNGYSLTWTDPNGILSNTSSPNPTFTPSSVGTLNFDLIVEDPDGFISESSSVTVTVLADESPVANAGNDFRFMSSEEGVIRNVVLDGSLTYDDTPKGNLSYQWTTNDNIPIVNSDNIIASFEAPIIDFGTEESFDFTLTVTNTDDSGNILFTNTDDVSVVIARLSTPISPELNAFPEHGQITLSWDDRSEDAIDSLTLYADFQGYRLYKSSDYGETWGNALVSSEGDTLGWWPIAIFDYSEDQDTSYCIYSVGEDNCIKSRGLEISGVDPYQYWFHLGFNIGLSQSFVDQNVLDGIDYVYTITAYDRGIKPSTQEIGSYDDQTGEWTTQVDHSFTEDMEANYYHFHKLDYVIESSYINGDNIYIYHLDVPAGYPSSFTAADEIDVFLSTNPDQYYIDIDENGEKQGYRSLESSKGITINDINYVLATPGYAASNMTFPDDNNLDDFLTADCRSIGNGTKTYEIVNLDELTGTLYKFEIQANSNVSTFQGYASENACLYAFPVIPDQQENARLDYRPINNQGEIIEYQDLSEDINTGEWYLDLNNNDINDGGEEELSAYDGYPGVSIDYSTSIPKIIVPEYYSENDANFECFPLEYTDDADYLNNYTDKIDGIRLRFDNAVRNEPTDKVALLSDVYSYPDSSFVNGILLDISEGADIELQYYTSFSKKPSFDYEVELYDTYVTESIDPGANCPESGTVGTKLPFKVKNLTTGKYVVLKHNDNGIFDGNPPPWWQGDEPGDGDCMWQPGELVYFDRDTVLVGTANDVEEEAEKTYALNMVYSIDQTINNSSNCDSYTNFSDVGNYSSGDCVYYEGMIWYASQSIYAINGYVPNEWEYNSFTEGNDNPWIPVYAWETGTNIVLKTQKWYVDEDYWVADMSMLGKGTQITQSEMDNIKVVPNPYMVYSRYNRDSHGLRFTHLPKECTITIYTISGEIVNIIEHNDLFDGDHFWDVKNKHGHTVAPGLYIYRVVEKETGIIFTSKFAVVK